MNITLRANICLLSLFLISCQDGAGNKAKRDGHPNGLDSERKNYMKLEWRIDATPVLTRSEGKRFDSRVVGDPCIVWDEKINTWRMFYFAGGYTEEGQWRVGTGMAVSRSI